MTASNGARALAELIGDRSAPSDPVVEHAVFGASDPALLAASLDAFTIAELGARIAAPRFYRVSVGCVAGVDLDDGRSVVVKVQAGKRRQEQLEACVAFREHLLGHDFPCAAPILGPRRLGAAWATVDAWDERGAPGDAREPALRRALARSLAELFELGRSFDRRHELGPAWFTALPEGRVFPAPHSPRFDFTSDAEAAAWIEALGAEARARRGEAVGALSVGHFDWRAEHLRFEGDRVVTSYDWDSLHLERETVLVGATAHAFTLDHRRGGVVHAPSIDDVRAFVADYEAARGASFSIAERRTIAASCVYSLAYTARCNLASSPDREEAAGDVRPLLRAEGRRLLDGSL